jgi:hypothetical protein
VFAPQGIHGSAWWLFDFPAMSCRSTSKGWHHCCWKWAKTAEAISQGCPDAYEPSQKSQLHFETLYVGKISVFTVKFAFIRTFCSGTDMIIMQMINLFGNELVEKLAIIFMAQESPVTAP